jgi:hypothetical protein
VLGSSIDAVEGFGSSVEGISVIISLGGIFLPVIVFVLSIDLE